MWLFVIVLGVAMIDAMLWKMVLEQQRHNQATEALLSEIRDMVKPKLENQ